jgi:hypothetical protein
MQKPKVACLVVLVLLSTTAFSQELHRYPWLAPPHLAIQKTGANTARVLTGLHTNIYCTLFEASSLTGPWFSSSGETSLASSNKFFSATADIYNLREGQYGLASTILFAIRIADPANNPTLTTSNGFQLRIEVTNWCEGISIFRVEDGPTTGDLVADFEALKQDLRDDERTQFVSTANVNRTGSGALCYTGYTDIFSILKNANTSFDHLADYDLELIRESPNTITARWTKAKSTSLTAQEERLRAAGFDASNLGTGCPL